MNQTFSLSRFGRLLRTYVVENRNALLANVAVLIVILVVLSWLVYRQLPVVAAHNRYIVLFFVGGAAWYIFTIQQVSVLNEKERAITYLLRPASKLEKWMQLFLISGLVFMSTHLLLFTVIDSVGVWYVNQRTWEPGQLTDLLNRSTIEPWFTLSQLRELPIIFWVGTVVLHPLTLAFALLIRRYTLPLIPVVVFIVVVFTLLANQRFLFTIIGPAQSMSTDPFADMHVTQTQNNWRMVQVPQPIGDVIRYGVGASAVLLLYVTAYFRLKEREV